MELNDHRPICASGDFSSAAALTKAPLKHHMLILS